MSLTAEGFVRQRLAEIKADYDKRFTDALGPVNTAPDSVTGQMIGIFSAALDDVYELLQDIYDSMYPPTAEGVSLDGAVSFIGMQRLGAESTSAVVMLYGSESTLVPQGALVRSLDDKQYATTADAVISSSNAGDATLEVTDVVAGAQYQVDAAGVPHIYTAASGDDANDIVDGLVAEFDSSSFLANNDGGKLRIRAVDQQSSFPLSYGSHLSLNKIGSPAVVICADTGAYEAPAGAISRIDTSVSGWDSVNNLVDGATGRDVETDDELRARHAESVRLTGAATAMAIKSRLLSDVPEVNYCRIFENRSGSIDAFGLPSHSFEVVVQGGLDIVVAKKLYELKPAGIETYGTTTVSVSDANGDAATIKFSRATEKYLWVRVTVDALYAEEPLTQQASGAIKDAVIAYAAKMDIGEDAIGQRFVGPIYAATTGIGAVSVEVAVTDAPGDTPTYYETVAIDRRSVAVADTSRISVLGL